MTPEAKLAAFAERIHLQDEDVDYLLTLVQEARSDSVLAEREACARVAGGVTGPGNTVDQCQGYSDACRDIVAAIRAREG